MSSEGTDHLSPHQAEKLTKALTATADQLFQLILEPDIDLLKAMLQNNNLSEEHLLVLLRRRDLPEEILRLVHQKRKKNLSHQLILALVKNPATPGGLMRALLPLLRLFELVDLCYLPGVTPDQRVAAERIIIQRLPTTPVGNKITLARRATTMVVGAILKEGDSRTMEACLNSPRLKETDIFQFLNSTTATATTISFIARHHRWKQRPNLRLSILKNRFTPEIWFTLWLPTLSSSTINQILASRRLGASQKKLVQNELGRRSKI